MCYKRTKYYYYYSIVLKGVVHTASLTILEGSLPTKFLSYCYKWFLDGMAYAIWS